MTLDPRICAHRGDHTRHLENTMEAFQSSIDLGCLQIELDVRRSADDVWVVHHDPTLERIHHIDLTIAECDAEQLLAVPGLSFLEAVLDAVPAEVRLLVENKETELTEKSGRAFVDMLEARMRRGGRVAAISHGSAWRSHLQTTDIDHYLFETSWDRALEEASGDFDGFDLYHAGGDSSPESRPKLIDALKEHQKDVAIWTVNDAVDGRSWLDAGVTSLITDHPETFLDV